jgi:CheY-like chemotaxis protein
VYAQVTSVTDGSEALHALEEGSTWPDIIFLDYYLREGETGEEVPS